MIAGEETIEGKRERVAGPDGSLVLEPADFVPGKDVVPAQSYQPYSGFFGRSWARIPPASGAEVHPEGSATLLSMNPDLSRMKEGVSHGLLPWL